MTSSLLVIDPIYSSHLDSVKVRTLLAYVLLEYFIHPSMYLLNAFSAALNFISHGCPRHTPADATGSGSRSLNNLHVNDNIEKINVRELYDRIAGIVW